MRALCAWVLAGILPLSACEGSSPPLGSGDNLHVDVDGSQQQPPMNDDDASDDSPFAPLDGPYGAIPDGYAPLANCAQCACPSGTFCYGGTPSTTVSACDQTAATGAALQPGCHALPAACASGTDCVCLLQSLASTLGQSCYAACTIGVGGGATTADAGDGGPAPLVVYCPG